ncbi:MAG: hypothetical protein GPJ54_09995 [Candidatus Heimdallarchaeota archaeon]|nr:hypothetical protein [Candidatus Heimdallarchaeota archaeon]
MKAQILLDENITAHLDSKGLLREEKGQGKLYVKNPSGSTTLWSVKLEANHGSMVSDFQNEEIAHLQQGQEYAQTYEIALEPNLTLTERIDTHYQNQTSDEIDVNRNTLVKGKAQKTLFEFTLENKYDFPLTNITLTKEFDGSLVELTPEGSHTGSVEPSESIFKWNLENMDAGAVAKLLIVAVIDPKSSEKIKTGQITVTAQGSGLLSDLAPTIDSECDNVDLSVDVNETESPGVWSISTEFINSSEFAVKLENVNVSTSDSKVVEDEVNSIYQPNPDSPSWSKIQSLNSNDYPTITKNFKYQVDHEVKSSISLNIQKDTDLLDIVEILAQKKFEPSQVNTYTRTPVEYEIEISNVGTGNIGSLNLEEVIPPFMLVHGVKVTGVEDPTVIAKFENQNALDEKTAVKEPGILENKRKLFVNVSTSSFPPGSKAKVTFDCTAEKPRPNLDYQARSIVKAYATSPTIAYEIQSMTAENVPELKMNFAKRSFKSLTNYKGVSDNEYEITIQVTNNGEVPLENIFVNHKITGGEYKNHQPVTVTVQENSGELEYFIKSIPVGSSIDLISMVETKGPIRQTQPSIRIAD